MHLPFTKMHGTGNRIVVVDQRGTGNSAPGPEAIRLMGDDHTGIGFDQLMWVTNSEDPDIRASYRVFNMDGSEVEQCGNGARCVARLLAEDGDSELLLSSPAGLIRARLLDEERVAVSMGPPVFEPDDIPFEADGLEPTYEIDVAGRSFEASVLSMGNPHCVIQVDSVDSAPVSMVGPLIEYHASFPERTNVGFMAVQSRHSIDLRVHERGAGETAACGTGACAAVVAGIRLGLLEGDVSVRLPGGELVVSWAPDTVWLTGDTELINEGSIDL